MLGSSALAQIYLAQGPLSIGGGRVIDLRANRSDYDLEANVDADDLLANRSDFDLDAGEGED